MKANHRLNNVAERFDTFSNIIFNCNKSKYCSLLLKLKMTLVNVSKLFILFTKLFNYHWLSSFC